MTPRPAPPTDPRGDDVSGVRGHAELVRRQAPYWGTVVRRTWRGSVVTAFLEPLFYVLAMGVLLGSVVDRSHPDLGGAGSYLEFVAPALAAAHAMQLAQNEGTWPVFSMIRWHRLYEGMLLTPLGVVDIVLAQALQAVARAAVASAVYVLVLSAFGVFADPGRALLAWAVQPLVAATFFSLSMALTVRLRSDQGIGLYYRLVVVPLFLFSGAFFPIDNLGPGLAAAAWATPLWHGVDLTRSITLGAVDPGTAAIHVGYLVAATALGLALSVVGLRRRLIV